MAVGAVGGLEVCVREGVVVPGVGAAYLLVVAVVAIV